jgi:hypothetical protein
MSDVHAAFRSQVQQAQWAGMSMMGRPARAVRGTAEHLSSRPALDSFAPLLEGMAFRSDSRTDPMDELEKGESADTGWDSPLPTCYADMGDILPPKEVDCCSKMCTGGDCKDPDSAGCTEGTASSSRDDNAFLTKDEMFWLQPMRHLGTPDPGDSNTGVGGSSSGEYSPCENLSTSCMDGVDVVFSSGCEDYEHLFKMAICMLVENFYILKDWQSVASEECTSAADDELPERLWRYLSGERTLRICCGSEAEILCSFADPYAVTIADWYTPLVGAIAGAAVGTIIANPVLGVIFGAKLSHCMYFCGWYLEFLLEESEVALQGNCSTDDLLCLIIELAAVLLHEMVHYSSEGFDTWGDEGLAWSVEGYFREQVALKYSVSSEFCCTTGVKSCYSSEDDAIKDDRIVSADRCCQRTGTCEDDVSEDYYGDDPDCLAACHGDLRCLRDCVGL